MQWEYEVPKTGSYFPQHTSSFHHHFKHFHHSLAFKKYHFTVRLLWTLIITTSQKVTTKTDANGAVDLAVTVEIEKDQTEMSTTRVIWE